MNLQPRILYPARLSFRFDDKIKSFTQAKAKRIQHHQTSFATNAKESFLGRQEKTTMRNREITNGKAHC